MEQGGRGGGTEIRTTMAPSGRRRSAGGSGEVRECCGLPWYTAAIMASMTEADIFSRVIDPSNPTLTAEAAKALLDLGYSEMDHRRMAELARKSNEGMLSDEERREFEGYVFVGDILAMLKSKARLSLRKQSPAA